MVQVLQEPVVMCRYGWGKTLRLFQDHLELSGKVYALTELEYEQLLSLSFFGIDVVRLVLRYQQEPLIIRGVVDIAAARRVVTSLTDMVSSEPAEVPTPGTSTVCAEPVSNQCTSEASATAFWEYGEVADDALTMPSLRPVNGESDAPTLSCTPLADVPASDREVLEQRLHRLRRLRTERAQREYGFDMAALALQLRSRQLPAIEVPACLLAGEVAHYCARSAHWNASYEQHESVIRQRAKDHGLLILTSKRLLYLGRKRQLAIEYTHIVKFLHTHGIIIVHDERCHLYRYFDVVHVIECSMYLEELLKRARPVQETEIQVVSETESTVVEVLAQDEAPTLVTGRPVGKDPALKVEDVVSAKVVSTEIESVTE